ncbi:MAG: hypothetical protein SH856_08590 [Flavobacteriales bacterium]|nr:hypothetical protein [Flavobacteriales bacterium]
MLHTKSLADEYDFTGPLWNKYFTDTRKSVRFPRGYKEVSMNDCEECADN